MHRNKIILKLLALGGLLVILFYAACAAYYWGGVSATDLYLYREAERRGFGHRPFPVAVGWTSPDLDWHFTPLPFHHDWRIHLGPAAVGLMEFESTDWAVWLGLGGYMVHFTSPAFLLLTVASIAITVLMFRRRRV